MSENPVAVTQALLRCPFCGGDEISHGWSAPGVDGSASTGEVQCHSCDLLLWKETEAEAIAAWNTRAQSPAAGLEREADGAPGGGMGASRFSIDEREDDMLIAERHWQFGWRCIARRPKLVTNDEWRPDAERIIAALTKPTPPACVSGSLRGVLPPASDAPPQYLEGWCDAMSYADGIITAEKPASVSGEVVTQADRYAAIGQTSSAMGGARWYIWKSGDAGNYVGGHIASKQDAEAIAEELNRLAAAPEAATASAVGGLLDVRPQLDAATPEPSLRQIVYGYYRAHFAADDAEKLTARYLAAFAPDKAPSAVGGVDRMREALATSHRLLRATHIGRGTRGGSCSLCGVNWNGEAERHRDDCPIAENDAVIATGETSPDRGRG